MRLLNIAELNVISGAGFAGEDSSYMCTYSLVQYYNSRLTMLEHDYNGDTLENAPWYASDQESLKMYQSWAFTYCPQEITDALLVI